MSMMEISLPDAVQEFLEERVVEDGYKTVSHYIRELIREDWKRRERETLEALLLEGLNSGPSKEMTPADWEEIRRQRRQRLAERDPNVTPSIDHLTVYIPENETT